MTVVRAVSGPQSQKASVLSGPSMTWSMPAATRSPLCSVRCTISAAVPPREPLSSLTRGASSAAATRGSLSGGGIGSLATSSDWTTMRAGLSTASTSKAMAATARCVNDTSRTDVTRITCPAGEAHSTRRCSVPARRSSTRSWARSVP